MKLSLLIGQWLHRLGYQLVPLQKKTQITVDITQLGFQLLRHYKKEISIVQIGAFDGSFQDPLQKILAQSHLYQHAILVEPQAIPFQSLQKQYQDNKKINLEHAAVSDQDGKIDLYLPKGKELSAEATINQNQLRRKGIALQPVEVSSITFRSLIKKYHLDTIDFLQIDAEGMDAELIRYAFDDSIFPSVIHFETGQLSSLDRDKLRKKLLSHHYQFIEYEQDCLAIQKCLIQ